MYRICPPGNQRLPMMLVPKTQIEFSDPFPMRLDEMTAGSAVWYNVRCRSRSWQRLQRVAISRTNVITSEFVASSKCALEPGFPVSQLLVLLHLCFNGRDLAFRVSSVLFLCAHYRLSQTPADTVVEARQRSSLLLKGGSNRACVVRFRGRVGGCG